MLRLGLAIVEDDGVACPAVARPEVAAIDNLGRSADEPIIQGARRIAMVGSAVA